MSAGHGPEFVLTLTVVPRFEGGKSPGGSKASFLEFLAERFVARASVEQAESDLASLHFASEFHKLVVGIHQIP